jgi:hypothetical protein
MYRQYHCKTCDILGSQSGDAENLSLLGCDAVWLGISGSFKGS